MKRNRSSSGCVVPSFTNRQLGIFALLIVALCMVQSMIFLTYTMEPPSPASVQNNPHTVPKKTTPKMIQQQQQPTKHQHPPKTTKRMSNLISGEVLGGGHATPHHTTSHSIPYILIFTHHKDLWTHSDFLQTEEELVLSANVRRSIAIHPQVQQVRFLTDDACMESLQQVFPALIPFFQNETEGMYKADICRGSALYETGGIYLDVDIGVRHDLWKDLWKTTEFVTSKVHKDSKWPGNFFQAILGAAPKSPIVLEYLQLLYDHYIGKHLLKKGPLGVILLRRAWDKIYNGTHPLTELYQEVLYHPKLFPNLQPAPTWGTRRACHFVVAAEANHPQNTEIKWKDYNLHVPLYSRIPGSRMCPRTTTNTTTAAASVSTNTTGKIA